MFKKPANEKHLRHETSEGQEEVSLVVLPVIFEDTHC